MDKAMKQAGQALPIVLMALGAGALMIGPVLGYVSTGLNSLRRGTEAVAQYYAVDAGVEHAIWRLKYGGLTIPTDAPFAYTYSTVNNLPVNLQIVNKSPVVDAACEAEDDNSTQSDRVTVGRTVSPTTAPPGVQTTFTVSVRFSNVGTSTIHYQEIGYTMPPGFTYVNGSAGGATANNPTQNGGVLTWIFGNPMPSIKKNETMVETFRMTGSLDDGVYCDYCDVAWVIFAPDSIGCVVYRSGERFNIRATAGATYVQSAILISGGGVRILSWDTK